LLLIGVHGLSYQQAAAIANCAVGTMKSRVSRARQHLEMMIEGAEPGSIEEEWQRSEAA
jgi:RNA polymerase sigma-70 factor (ECF subfamily)